MVGAVARGGLEVDQIDEGRITEFSMPTTLTQTLLVHQSPGNACRGLLLGSRRGLDSDPAPPSAAAHGAQLAGD